ncbi:MAG TPA: hypothetical protein VIK78_14785 [Ruminiclostridium sp.]
MKSKTVSKLIAFTTAVVMVMSLAACGGSSVVEKSTSGDVSSTTTTTAEQTTQKKDTVKLRILVMETGTKWNSFPDNHIAKEIENQTGITFEVVESDETKFKVLLAGGDLPDIVRADPSKYAKQMIEGNLVIPMDDLINTNGKDITANISSEIDVAKKFWSNETGKVYYIAPQVVAAPTRQYLVDIGATVRWDYYKELGTPEIKNQDDLIKVLTDMVAKHPKTDDGKKTYGVSFWNDWESGLWGYNYYPFFEGGEANAQGGIMTWKTNTTALYNRLTTEDSGYWKTITFLNKAKKAGILDPDALTMKYDDFMAKGTAGQVLFAPSQWSTGDFNKNNAKDGKGYMTIPVGSYAWTGQISPFGWQDKAYCISSSSKTPDRAMDLLNYFFSYDGCRTLWSGVKGVDWDVVDGKPVIKDATVKLQSTGGTEWDSSGIQLEKNFMGMGNGVINPADGAPLSLFETDEIYASRLSPLEKSFCDQYGVRWPGEIFSKMSSEGTLLNLSSSAKETAELTINGLISPAVGTPPDDIKKIEAKVVDIAAKRAAALILSKSDAEFDELKAKTMADFKAADIDKVTEWYMKAWSDAKVKVGAK